MLAKPERKLFFEHMRRVAEISDHAGGAGILLRRQASYLCSYDRSDDTRAWLAHMQRRKPPRLNHASWTPEWADARSFATSLTRHGEDDVLHAFIERGMSSDAGEIANLNYWAHWLGLDRLPRPDDTFMAARSRPLWDAGALLRSLADRLDPRLGCVDLNIHSVWSLIGSHPGLLTADPPLVSDLKDRVAVLFDCGTVSQQARRELDAVYYGLRLNNS
ncbi:transcriptional regulator [Streptomyces sp. NPDC093085]|uniref:transcriptional regulator n=1 Tax=Streptomyces sp. NPDC093085 TaxID=3155068 RepID=UPI0034252D2F